MLRRIGLFAVVGMLTVLVLAACGKQEEKTESTVTRVPASNVPVLSPTPGAAAAASPAAGGSPVASPIASPATTGPASPVAAAPSTASPVASPAAGGTAAGPSTAVSVSLEDIKFDPTELTIPANTPATITVTNKGQAVHTFDVDALNIHSGQVQPGATKTIDVNAAPGDYQYYCAEPGHKQAGMVGTLHVVASGGAPAASPAAASPVAAASPAASPAAGGVTAAQTIDLVDIKFQPNALTIPANTEVTINLVNKGVTAHTFDIDALNIHTGDIAPGSSTSVTINAPAGNYEYYCAIPGHKQAGMTGTLTVQ
ncbi:MAG TPA: cupredoxin domain-containing protein [Thermomicrobiales bacterium]